MKRLLLLMVACVSFASCSDSATLNSEFPTLLEELQKQFDFSEVNTEGLEIKKVYEFQDNEDNGMAYTFVSTHPDLAVVVGEIDKCLWLGLFNKESGKIKYQYTDIEHPISYSAYGIEYEYGVGNVCGIHFEDNCGAIAIQYNTNEKIGKYRADIITFDQTQKTYRTAIGDNFSSAISDYQIWEMPRWSSHTIYLRFLPIIYDISKNETLCNIKYLYDEVREYYYIVDFGSLVAKKDFVSSSNPLHFWNISLGDEDKDSFISLGNEDSFLGNNVKIREIQQCSYDAITIVGKEIELFEPYAGDSSKAPRYSVEYKTKTDNRIVAVVTQTEYDGAITTKTVDIRVENDELIVDVQ